MKIQLISKIEWIHKKKVIYYSYEVKWMFSNKTKYIALMPMTEISLS